MSPYLHLTDDPGVRRDLGSDGTPLELALSESAEVYAGLADELAALVEDMSVGPVDGVLAVSLDVLASGLGEIHTALDDLAHHLRGGAT